MSVKSFFLIVAISLYPVFCRAQDLNTRILMSVDGNRIEAGEFIRMYKKSAEPGKLPEPDTYLKQFTVFKLKVAAAINEGYDTTRSFRTELNGYRTQLAAGYLTDPGVKDKFIRQQYDRSLTEINAWHILIAVSPNASPSDTLNAWNKAIDVRKRLINGESFETVARGFSDDKSALINGGNLGYFSAFQMVMPFENAAYTLKKGEISMPVRSTFGYHIIKVVDTRPSRGKIKVAHIMKAIRQGASETESAKAEEEIRNIYKMLLDGASFSDLAKKYSDHRESATKGGELNWFGTSEIISDFAVPAFALNDTGKFTEPVRTQYGWHIIKLLDRKKPGSFEETKPYLESRINQTWLSSVSRKSFTDKLKKEYNFHLNKSACNWFKANTGVLIMNGTKKYDRKTLPAANLYTFSGNKLSSRDFADFIEKSRQAVSVKDSSEFIDQMIENSAEEQLINYENSFLEKKHPDFRYLMNEFHDGMLLFQISEKNIWSKIGKDSAALHSYFENNKSKWLTEKGITDASLLKYSDIQEEVMNDYQEYLEKEWLEQLNKKYAVKVDDSVMNEVKKKLKNE